MNDIKLTTLTESDLGKVQMFCGHSPTYKRGYEAKTEWLRARLREGMRYTLLTVRGRNAGLMEYVPGEYAWRGVEAAGYLFIHCFWVIGRNRGHGYGRQLLEACLDDARGTNGVALVVSKAHWLPTPKLFLKNGFELADHADPSFDLLVRRIQPDAPLPRFKRNTPKFRRG
ncbi:MAG: GNAT family N-acetyltransferase [Chloroflexota bacterium]